jgi:hypothetical protein
MCVARTAQLSKTNAASSATEGQKNARRRQTRTTESLDLTNLKASGHPPNGRGSDRSEADQIQGGYKAELLRRTRRDTFLR